MSLFGFNFTSNQAVDYIKQNWKPGKREFMYVSVYAAIFIVGELLRATAGISSNQMMEITYGSYYSSSPGLNMPTVDPNLVFLRDFGVGALELFTFFMMTYLYFNTSDKSVHNGLKWGVGYALPIAVLSLIFSIHNSLTYPAMFGYNSTLMTLSNIVYFPASFLFSLLSAGGLYLLFVYKPKINLIAIGYVAMIVFMAVLSFAFQRNFSPYSAEVIFNAVIALSLLGLYFSVKNQLRIKFPTVILFAGIGVGFFILSYISELAGGNFVPYWGDTVQVISFIAFGFLTYFLLNKFNIKPSETLPPPPPEPNLT